VVTALHTERDIVWNDVPTCAKSESERTTWECHSHLVQVWLIFWGWSCGRLLRNPYLPSKQLDPD